MAVTHKLIETITVGSGGAASIDFTSIPTTYTDLSIWISGRTNQATTISNLLLQFNGDTSANYNSINLYGNGSIAQYDNAFSSAYIYGGPVLSGSVSTSSIFGNCVVYIPNYTISASKSLNIDGVTEDNETTRYTAFAAGIWSGTAAITSIKIFTGGSANLVQYSSASLYGINNS